MRKLAVILLILALPAAAGAEGAGGANTSILNTPNIWRAPQLGCWNPIGCVSPRIGAVFNAIGPLKGENNLFDGVSYNGFSQFVAERYDYSGGKFTGVGANETVGGFFGAAQMNTGSDPVDAAMIMYTTEAQTAGHNGMGLELDYTPNGSTALTRGLSVSPQGRGGVTIGGGYTHAEPYEYKAPSDLGPGTLHVADSIVTENHLRSDGPAPRLSSCGGATTVAGSTDVKGQVVNKAGITSCTVKFARDYEAGSLVVCMVQDFATSTPAPYLSSVSPESITVSWPSSFSGSWFYMCAG